MIDDRLLRAFRELDAPVEPDARFADGLFEDLAGDLGLRGAGEGTGGVRDRLRRLLGLERPPSGIGALRLAYVAALAGLLLALLAGTLYVASQLRSRPSPLELVRLSQAAYADPPPVRFTMRDAMGETVVTSDGRGTWRSTAWDMPAESYDLYDGDRVGIYDATTRAWRVNRVEDGGPPFPFNDIFTWVDISFPNEKAVLAPVDCSAATDLGEATVAGRPTDGVGCPAIGMSYWIDRATHLVLRASAGPGSPSWVGPDGRASVTEVTAFETVDAPDAALFAWAGPAETARPAGPVAGTKLVVGESAPAWSGPTLDGAPFSVPSPGAPAALLLFGTWCPPCVPAFDAFNAAAARHPEVEFAVVGIQDPPGALAGFVGQHGASMPVVADEAQGLSSGWGIGAVPMIVLLDGQGAVADVVAGGLGASDLDRVLAALAAGAPIPAVQPASPAPSAGPGAASSAGPAEASPGPGFECTEERVTCLPDGAHAGAWSGPAQGGGTIVSADLVGKPAVLWFESPAMCDGPCPDWVTTDIRSYQALAERYGDRATVLLVTASEKVPGDTERQLREAGATFPVVYDWDGSISRAYDLAVMGVLVLDREGRVVEAFPHPFGSHAASTEDALGRLLEAPPAP